jgi:2-keto-3-deoxy-L-rhamnonate aldolase RhmA
MADTRSFRQRLLAGDKLVGTFLKTPTSHATEIVAGLGFDFAVIDQEHAPFDRTTTDIALMAARGSGIPALVRVSGPEAVLSVLDGGASGILMPHVASAGYAREVAALCRYRKGSRGYATSTRAGGYTTVPMWQHIRAADETVTVIAQIEDPDALDQIDAIAAVEGIDSLFIGRGDLTAAFGNETPNPPEVRTAVEKICAAARRASKPVSVYVGGRPEAEWLRDQGATAFIHNSDQGFLRQAAMKGLAEMRDVLG